MARSLHGVEVWFDLVRPVQKCNSTNLSHSTRQKSQPTLVSQPQILDIPLFRPHLREIQLNHHPNTKSQLIILSVTDTSYAAGHFKVIRIF